MSLAGAYIVLNIVTNVSIILVNKYVFSIYEFNYATLVTFLHFVFTAYVGKLARHSLGVCWCGVVTCSRRLFGDGSRRP